jgi:DNA polymerase-4
MLHVRCRPGTGEADFRALLALIHGVSPAVQSLPPSAALVDVTAAARYWDASPYDLAERIRLRAQAALDVEVRIGAGPSWTVAAMASKTPQPVTAVAPEAVRAYLDPLPVGMLHGIGPAQAEQLLSYGLHTVGALAAAPEAAVRRILGDRAGHLLRERARGVDPRRVIPSELPGTAGERRVLDPGPVTAAAVRAAVRDAAAAVDARLGRRGQAAGGLCLEVALGGGSTLSRTTVLGRPEAASGRARRVPRPAAAEDLRAAASRMLDALHLQRARVRGVTVVADRLASSEAGTRRISLVRVPPPRPRADPAATAVPATPGPGAPPGPVRPAALPWRKAG